jgi:FixJ family two-component response regulator
VKPKIAVCFTEVDMGAIMRAKRAGAQDYLLKPFNRPHIARTVPRSSVCSLTPNLLICKSKPGKNAGLFV